MKSHHVKGGFARAEALSEEERSAIASNAAGARWGKPVAHFEGELDLGTAKLNCAVVEIDGEVVRLISSSGFMRALQRPWKGSYERIGRPNFLEAENLQPFIGAELKSLLDLIDYRTPQGGSKRGYRAEIVPLVCEVYLSARDVPDGLQLSQHKIAKACEIIMRSLAKLGIVALVDEATGYQEVRDRLALQKILEKYVTDEWARWTRTFPDDFYRNLFRLKGVNYPIDGSKKPMYVGHWTNDIVYSRLAPGVLEELRKKNPRDEFFGNRRRKHHQYLTRDYGHPALKEHLSNVTFLMKTCSTDGEFKKRLEAAAPKYGQTPLLPLGIDRKRVAQSIALTARMNSPKSLPLRAA
jgi:P63C domain